jgi:hypothetical protein
MCAHESVAPPKIVTLGIRVDAETAAELLRRARVEDRSVSAVARRLLVAGLTLTPAEANREPRS